jgi:prophage regulatory protein
MNSHAPARPADPTSIRLQRFPDVQAALGLSRANIYARVRRGLLTRPIKIGSSTTWPSNEIASIVGAHVDGRSDTEIAELVRELHKSRDSKAEG